jgi:hypothetical protein
MAEPYWLGGAAAAQSSLVQNQTSPLTTKIAAGVNRMSVLTSMQARSFCLDRPSRPRDRIASVSYEVGWWRCGITRTRRMEVRRRMKVVLALMVVIGMLATTAAAQPVTGFYVQGCAGLDLPQQQTLGMSPPASAQGQAPASSAAAAANAAINGGAGGVQSGSAGWGFGNGMRMELEGVHAAQGSGSTN